MSSGTQIRVAPIILLEDSRDDAFFVRHALEKAHIVNPLIGFRSVEQARAHLAQPVALPALFVMDIHLAGGETGVDFLRWLRQQPQALGSTPAMMLTGSTRAEDRSEAELLGSVHFLLKPVTEETLTEAVQSLGFVVSSLTGSTMQRTIERRFP